MQANVRYSQSSNDWNDSKPNLDQKKEVEHLRGYRFMRAQEFYTKKDYILLMVKKFYLDPGQKLLKDIMVEAFVTIYKRF